MNKKTISKLTALAIYLNYYFLCKLSLIFFPIIAIYAILFNRSIVPYAISAGICTYCLYFQGSLPFPQIEETDGDKEKTKQIIRSDKVRSISIFICLLLGIVCSYFAWTDLIVHIIGVQEFKNFMDSLIM